MTSISWFYRWWAPSTLIRDGTKRAEHQVNALLFWRAKAARQVIQNQPSATLKRLFNKLFSKYQG
jgi:hypothetical protein